VNRHKIKRAERKATGVEENKINVAMGKNHLGAALQQFPSTYFWSYGGETWNIGCAKKSCELKTLMEGTGLKKLNSVTDL